MHKIMIFGTNSGSGKSTFARLLGEKLNITPTYLDTIFWKPGWQIAPSEEIFEKIEEVLTRERWIIEGSYTRFAIEKRIELADTIFLFDFNRFICFIKFA